MTCYMTVDNYTLTYRYVPEALGVHLQHLRETVPLQSCSDPRCGVGGLCHWKQGWSRCEGTTGPGRRSEGGKWGGGWSDGWSDGGREGEKEEGREGGREGGMARVMDGVMERGREGWPE